MNVFLSVEFRIFATDEEYPHAKDLLHTYLAMTSEEMKKEKLSLQEDVFKNQEGAHIHILSVATNKMRYVKRSARAFFAAFTKNQLHELLKQVESRVDEECNFFIRLDKTELFAGSTVLTDTGNCLHATLNVASYPKKKEVACLTVQNYINKLLHDVPHEE